jgi:hypothetical protein
MEFKGWFIWVVLLFVGLGRIMADADNGYLFIDNEISNIESAKYSCSLQSGKSC